MSASLGHKRNLRLDFLMSALTPTTDIRAHRKIGRKVPLADICTEAKRALLIDHLVGARKGRRSSMIDEVVPQVLLDFTLCGQEALAGVMVRFQQRLKLV